MTFDQLPDEWKEWLDLQPLERFARSERMLVEYIAMGTPIRQVLSTFQKTGVRTLLMGGQACVFYGAAQVSKDIDFLVLAEQENFVRLEAALVPVLCPKKSNLGFGASVG